MSLAGYIPMHEAVEVTGYTDGRLRQLLRAGLLKGKKIAPRLWMVNEKAAKTLADERNKQRSKSA